MYLLGGGEGDRSRCPRGNSSTRAASFSKLSNRSLTPRSFDCIVRNSVCCWGVRLGFIPGKFGKTTRGACEGGGAAANRLGGSDVAGVEDALPHRDFRLRGMGSDELFAPSCCCLRYSFRASFHPGQFSTSFHMEGYAPNFSFKPFTSLDVLLVYHSFILTWSVRTVVTNSAASSLFDDMVAIAPHWYLLYPLRFHLFFSWCRRGILYGRATVKV